MTACAAEPMRVERDAPVPTWFGVGGRADRLARPGSVDDVIACVRSDPDLRVLGDGANLLVDDAGVRELVVSLSHAEMRAVRIDAASGRVVARGGADLPKLINETVRAGLGGLEVLAGVPATVGGAVMMNAGGTFGEIASVVSVVRGVNRRGERVELPRRAIDFGYRRSGLGAGGHGLIITEVEFELKPASRDELRERQVEIMRKKKESQPMAARSAGCCFKNPTLAGAIAELGEAGSAGRRVGAGLLIDRAGLKGLRVGGAEVSDRHANFLVTHAGCTARDLIALMDEVEKRVAERFGVRLEREVVVWSSEGGR